MVELLIEALRDPKHNWITRSEGGKRISSIMGELDPIVEIKWLDSGERVHIVGTSNLHAKDQVKLKAALVERYEKDIVHEEEKTVDRIKKYFSKGI